MADHSKLQAVLERTRQSVAELLSPAFVEDVAEVEERNQFDDDRGPVRTELRRLVALETDRRLESESKT